MSLAPDADGHAILTWMDGHWSSRHNLYYALVDSAGNVLSPAMPFRTSAAGMRTSFEGYGNASYRNMFSMYMPLSVRGVSLSR